MARSMRFEDGKYTVTETAEDQSDDSYVKRTILFFENLQNGSLRTKISSRGSSLQFNRNVAQSLMEGVIDSELKRAQANALLAQRHACEQALENADALLAKAQQFAGEYLFSVALQLSDSAVSDLSLVRGTPGFELACDQKIDRIHGFSADWRKQLEKQQLARSHARLHVDAAEKAISCRLFYQALVELAKIPSSLTLSSSNEDKQLLSSIESLNSFASSLVQSFTEVHSSKSASGSQSLADGQKSFEDRKFHEALDLFDSSRVFANEASDPTPYVGPEDSRITQWINLCKDCEHAYHAADAALQKIAENSKKLRIGMDRMAEGERHMLGRDYESAVASFTSAESVLRNVDETTCERASNLRMECESMIAQERRSTLLLTHMSLISKLADEPSDLWHDAGSDEERQSRFRASIANAELRNDVVDEQMKCCRSFCTLPTSLSVASAFIWDHGSCMIWDQRITSCSLSERISEAE